ncbi:lipoyl synthase [Candidatus Peregrinibacteria bacterium]|nr:lipoyl synthase [Candidatus Peregrinibacteria bacterium]
MRNRINPLTKPKLISGDLKKPAWMKIKAILPNARYRKIKETAHRLKIATVCAEAGCPNVGECWESGTATFMLMGDTCTRACKFCNVKHGKPQPLDPNEPQNLAEAIAKLGVNYAVITCVDRDDVPDGGAEHFAKCISYLRKNYSKLVVEVLVSDFQGDCKSIQKVVAAAPHVYGHNIETVERLQAAVRDRRANYRQSLGTLEYVKKIAPKMSTKSSIMVGLGEKPAEVVQTMKDLRKAQVDFLTIGQYLRPSEWNLKVVEYIPPEQFEEYRKTGEELGFIYVAAGPYVRSSYKAGELFIKNALK